MRFLIAIILLLFTANAFAVEARIYAQRMTTGGAKSGSAIPLNIGTTGQPQSQPKVAFLTDLFLVVYNEWNGSDLDVKAVRVMMNGAVLDDPPITIKSGAKTQAMPDVAADTTGWMVVWQGWAADSHFPRIYANRVEYNGAISPAAEINFGDADGFGSDPHIAYSATDDKFGVIFSGSNHDRMTARFLYSTVLSTTPAVVYGAGDYIGGRKIGPVMRSLTANPTGGWTFVVSGDASSIYISRSGMGAVELDNTGSISAGNYLTANDDMYTQWGTDKTVFLDATSTGSGATAEFTWGFNDVAQDASYDIAVWERQLGSDQLSKRYVDCSLYAARLGEAGNFYDPVEALGGTAIALGNTTTSIGYRRPAIAGNKSGTLLITYDKTTAGSMEIGSKLLTGAGSGISPGAEVIIRDATNGTRRSHSDVAYGDDGSTQEFMVVWTEGWWGAL